jgi:hypothetical protein
MTRVPVASQRQGEPRLVRVSRSVRGSLYWRRRKLSACDHRVAPATAQRFVPATGKPAELLSGLIEVVLAKDRRLHVGNDVSPGRGAELVATSRSIGTILKA